MAVDWRDTLRALLPQFEALATKSPGLNHLMVESADDERDIGHQAIADTKHRGAGQATSDGAVARMRFGAASEVMATHFFNATD